MINISLSKKENDHILTTSQKKSVLTLITEKGAYNQSTINYTFTNKNIPILRTPIWDMLKKLTKPSITKSLEN